MGLLSRLRNGSTANTADALEEIDELTRRNRDDPDAELEARILELRHRAALGLIEESGASPAHAEQAGEIVVGETGLPEVEAREMSPDVLRAAILSHGCLLVRGLIDEAEVDRLKATIDRAFEAREEGGRSDDGDFYREFPADPRFDLSERAWIAGRSNFWGVDSPRVMVNLFDTFERTGLRGLAESYLGERPAISVNKCTLRRVYPSDFEGSTSSSWHQDGAFLGEVRALNVWLSLSRCGDLAPGLDLVPRRLEEIVETGTEGAAFDWSVSQALAEEVAGERRIVRPIFEAGDVLLFDEMLLHGTAADSGMPNPRYAVECWFFGPSAFPADYAPLVS